MCFLLIHLSHTPHTQPPSPHTTHTTPSPYTTHTHTHIHPHRSVNEVICHGIPDGRELVNGDICNGTSNTLITGAPSLCLITYFKFFSLVDITVYHNGFHGDLNETFFVGEVDDANKKLVQTAHECMMKGIAIGELTAVRISKAFLIIALQESKVLYVFLFLCV